MTVFAALVLDPGSIAAWICVGIAIGGLAGLLMEPPSYGKIGDLILGGVGGLIGGFVFGFFGGSAPPLWGGMLVALLGAGVVIACARVFVAWRNA